MRDSKGRYTKSKKIEIPLPSIQNILTSTRLLFLLLPWIYVLISRFNSIGLISDFLNFLFHNENDGNANEKTNKMPY